MCRSAGYRAHGRVILTDTRIPRVAREHDFGGAGTRFTRDVEAFFIFIF